MSASGAADPGSPRSCRATSSSSTARCAPAGSRTSSARRRSRTSWRSRSPPRPAAATRWTTCCWRDRRGSARHRWPRSSPPSWRSPFVQTAGPGARAQGRRGGVPDRAGAPGGVLRRRDPPAAARAGGDLLPGDGGRRAADHRGPGSRRAGGDAAAAAVHADRRHHPGRPADHAAARPLRDPAPPRALRPRGPGPDRDPLGGAARGRDRGRRGRWRSPAAAAARPRVANRLLKRVRDYAEVRHRGVVTGEVASEALDLLQVDEEGLDRLDREILLAICDKFGGGPVGLSTLAVAVGEERDTIEDVYEPYLLQRGLDRAHPARSGRHPAGVRAPRARAAGAAGAAVVARRDHRRSAACLSCLAMSRERYFICPHCGNRSMGTDRNAGFRREARGCEKCGFAYLFELLDDYYPAPNAAFFACDADGRIVDCGRGSFELTGLKTEQAIGRPVRDVLGLRFEDGTDHVGHRARVGGPGPGQAGRGPRRARPPARAVADIFPAYDDDEGGVLVVLTPTNTRLVPSDSSAARAGPLASSATDVRPPASRLRPAPRRRADRSLGVRDLHPEDRAGARSQGRRAARLPGRAEPADAPRHPGRAQPRRRHHARARRLSWASPSPRSRPPAATRSPSGCPTCRTPSGPSRRSARSPSCTSMTGRPTR